MNKDRRKAIDAIIKQINELNMGDLEDIISQIEAVRDEEQEYFDNMVEAFQNGEKGSAAEMAIEQMDSAINGLDAVCGALSEIEGAISSLEEAKA